MNRIFVHCGCRSAFCCRTAAFMGWMVEIEPTLPMPNLRDPRKAHFSRTMVVLWRWQEGGSVHRSL